jgi:hypothetical protein
MRMNTLGVIQPIQDITLAFIARSRIMARAVPRRSGDLGFLLAHHVLAAVVTALGAYGVINMPCSTVRALSDGRGHSHIVGAALSGTSLRLSSFRMCHFLVVYLKVIVLSIF